MSSEPHDGRRAIERDGLSYLPRFISTTESDQLVDYFGALRPIWERRHSSDDHGRPGAGSRRITRPVYWLGAWQFASLGYYAEPHFREDRCVRGEPFPTVINDILARLRPVLDRHDCSAVDDPIPNTCLINYYGSTHAGRQPVDQARLRMHRDGEPGPVLMFCIGQPGLFEFLESDRPETPELALWTRHRSVLVFSGPRFKDELYHRLLRVRHGTKPSMRCSVEDFALRRVSISFRHVPGELISDFGELPQDSREQVGGYVRELAQSSDHYARQLATDPLLQAAQPER